MKRREFIALFAGAVVWSLEARAQQKKTYRIGVLSQDLQPGLLETFRDELHKRGYVEGSDISIELRNAAGHNERLLALADELLKLKVDVIVAVNTPAVQAAKKATSTVPVVMMRVADPVKSGLVDSLARPGGNITGLSFMPDALGPKGVELLHEMLPKATRMAALFQGNNPGAVLIIDEVQRKGEQIGIKFVRLPIATENDFPAAFEAASKAKVEALFVMDDGAITKHRQQIAELRQSTLYPSCRSTETSQPPAGLSPMDRTSMSSTGARRSMSTSSSRCAGGFSSGSSNRSISILPSTSRPRRHLVSKLQI